MGLWDGLGSDLWTELAQFLLEGKLDSRRIRAGSRRENLGIRQCGHWQEETPKERGVIAVRRGTSVGWVLLLGRCTWLGAPLQKRSRPLR